MSIVCPAHSNTIGIEGRHIRGIAFRTLPANYGSRLFDGGAHDYRSIRNEIRAGQSQPAVLLFAALLEGADFKLTKTTAGPSQARCLDQCGAVPASRVRCPTSGTAVATLANCKCGFNRAQWSGKAGQSMLFSPCRPLSARSSKVRQLDHKRGTSLDVYTQHYEGMVADPCLAQGATVGPTLPQRQSQRCHSASPTLIGETPNHLLDARERQELAERLGYRSVGAPLPHGVTLSKVVSTLPKDVSPLCQLSYFFDCKISGLSLFRLLCTRLYVPLSHTGMVTQFFGLSGVLACLFSVDKCCQFRLAAFLEGLQHTTRARCFEARRSCCSRILPCRTT